MPVTRHCPHCLGNCSGECMTDDLGHCIHGGGPRLPWRLQFRLLSSRRWWHRIFWGPR